MAPATPGPTPVPAAAAVRRSCGRAWKALPTPPTPLRHVPRSPETPPPAAARFGARCAADSGPGSWSEVSGLTAHPGTACTSAPTACNINPKHYPISGIALDPHDTTGNTAYVTVMGFGVGHVFKTTDGGSTWAMLDGNPTTTGLPDAPADSVVADSDSRQPGVCRHRRRRLQIVSITATAHGLSLVRPPAPVPCPMSPSRN